MCPPTGTHSPSLWVRLCHIVTPKQEEESFNLKMRRLYIKCLHRSPRSRKPTAPHSKNTWFSGDSATPAKSLPYQGSSNDSVGKRLNIRNEGREGVKDNSAFLPWAIKRKMLVLTKI